MYYIILNTLGKGNGYGNKYTISHYLFTNGFYYKIKNLIILLFNLILII